MNWDPAAPEPPESRLLEVPVDPADLEPLENQLLEVPVGLAHPDYLREYLELLDLPVGLGHLRDLESPVDLARPAIHPELPEDLEHQFLEDPVVPGHPANLDFLEDQLLEVLGVLECPASLAPLEGQLLEVLGGHVLLDYPVHLPQQVSTSDHLISTVY